MNIMFVCHGNICRSPMAEFMFTDMIKRRGLEAEFVVESSATSTEEIGNGLYPPAAEILREYGVPTAPHSAVQFKKEDYDYYDYIICMDGYNIRNLMRIVGSDPQKKIFKLLDFAGGGDIADPWYSGGFNKTYSDIMRGLKGFLREIKKDG